ncbi:MAG TPA: aspartate carbamoyltransferase [Candidatus Paceibacterota bacterium]|nr:aspartate carbamoyltransferase [Candidatus Paceibacterota bacterium]
MPHRLRGQSIIWSQDFDMPLLDEIFERADKFKEAPRSGALKDKRVISLFFEKSTRTRMSFEAAVDDLGGSRISTEDAMQFSSFGKGEPFEEGIQVIAAYGDAIILRHPADDAAMLARDYLQSFNVWVPIINAGCGKAQHPTQSLLDLYTIRDLRKRIENLTIVIVGDLKHSRVVRSLIYLLGKYSGIRIILVAPWELTIGHNMLAYMRRHGVEFVQAPDLAEVIGEADIVYMTRVQKERFSDPTEYERLKHSYRLTVALAEKMRTGAFIMHPLPRVDEIDEEVSRMPQASWIHQSNNGVPVRKALLEMILGE